MLGSTSITSGGGSPGNTMATSTPKHFYPPALRNCEFTPHSLVGEMDYAGVDVALLHTDPMLVRDSGYMAECVALYPDRAACDDARGRVEDQGGDGHGDLRGRQGRSRTRAARRQVQPPRLHGERRAVGRRLIRAVLGCRHGAWRPHLLHTRLRAWVRLRRRGRASVGVTWASCGY